ncbi:hypothetical protein FDG2_5150 [Candidatus Protofrankia californiensis]|uniref:Uncharacterized protein n=1 Tax=Candidatus Protofrankia californiensis TaxID=1839754 RepID=A0A1C3PB90_9ACTN|nr:hypothetical protein FDG2_5150 [Candidatus Protofrankia californiensis]
MTSSHDGVETIPGAYRAYVLDLLDRDSAYDNDPVGAPPLLVADYRHALLAVLTATPSPLLRAGPAVTDAEAAAFTAGQHTGLDRAVIAIGEAWRPALLRRHTPGTRHDLPAFRGRTSHRRGTTPVFAVRCARACLPPAPAGPPPGPTAGSAPEGPAGRLLVVDGDGEVVACFDRARFPRAHEWAHQRAAEPHARRPVWIEDLGRRESWRIDATSCRQLRWQLDWDTPGCSMAIPPQPSPDQ